MCREMTFSYRFSPHLLVVQCSHKLEGFVLQSRWLYPSGMEWKASDKAAQGRSSRVSHREVGGTGISPRNLKIMMT